MLLVKAWWDFCTESIVRIRNWRHQFQLEMENRRRQLKELYGGKDLSARWVLLTCFEKSHPLSSPNGRVVKMIWSSRRIKVSRWHWGPEAPPGGKGSGDRLGPQQGKGAEPRWGSRGRSPQKRNGFEVFALAEIGSPKSNANNPEYLFLNEHHHHHFLIQTPNICDPSCEKGAYGFH